MGSICETETPTSNIYIPEQWSEAAESVAYDSVSSPPPITLVCGAKNCGKTTFSRHLVNILLQRYKKVAYLDTDVGQSEFTPPGCLSLNIIDQMTPDLAIPCMKTPVRCYFFGDISSKRDPTIYLSYIFSLYDYYRKEYCVLDKSGKTSKPDLPIVINTPGWVKGIGYDILVEMLKYMSPSHVVKINISSETKNLPFGAFWLDQEDDMLVNLIEVNSARQDSYNRSVLVQKDARQLRDFRIMAYFRQCFQSDANVTQIKQLAHALASHPPYEISMSNVKIKHLHCQVPDSDILYSLNATIVGLAIGASDSDSPPPCVGLGIVRGIDSVKHVLYLITPIPHIILEKVDSLLQGFIQIPISLLQVQGSISPYMSANVLPTN